MKTKKNRKTKRKYRKKRTSKNIQNHLLRERKKDNEIDEFGKTDVVLGGKQTNLEKQKGIKQENAENDFISIKINIYKITI